MGKYEQKINGFLQRYPKIKKYIKRIYQIGMYVIFPKVNSEGEIYRISPDDEFEYFFGYYDKSPWDVTGKYILSIRVKNAYKEADSTEKAEIVLIDTENNNIKIIAVTHCWNVQQGCMLQWLGPDYSERIIYNDFLNDKYCSIILNIKTNEKKILRKPVYAVSEDGSYALSLDFSRLHKLRPGYGYNNIKEEKPLEFCPDSTCIWKINLKTNECIDLLKYTDLKNFETRPEMEKAQHKVNHLMISPNGKRFMFLHRWLVGGRKYTRLITANPDGTGLYNLLDDNFVSHCYWKDDKDIITFAEKREIGRGYFILKDKTHEIYHLWHNLVEDGHPSYGPNGLIVTDTYPDRRRLSSVYLLKESDDCVKRIARVFSPFKYDGDIRCDLHPRWKRDGSMVCIDAVFEGKRSLYVIPIKENQKNEKKRILVCLRRCVNKGPVHQTFNILNNIDQRKIEPYFLTMKQEAKDDSIYSKFCNLSINRRYVDGNKKDLFLGILFGRGRIIKEIENIKPDVIHTTGIIVDLIGYRASKKLNIKQIVTVRNYVYEDYLKKFGKVKGIIISKIHLNMMKKFKSTCLFICCSKSLSDKYWKKNKIRMEYIRNGVDNTKFSEYNLPDKLECRRLLNLPQEGFIIITVAQVIERKNIPETIEALPKEINGKKVYFILVGDGTELEKLKEKYSERKSIIFAGRQSNVEKWLMASDLFVSSSESEGLPNSVIEAMSIGLPVVLSNIPQHEELFGLNSGVGYLYELHNIKNLSEVLRSVKKHDLEIFGKQGKKLANGELSAKRMSNQYQELYRRL